MGPRMHLFPVRLGLLLLAGGLASPVLKAQTPLDAARAMAGAPQTLEGQWANVDPQAKGLVAIIVSKATVHPFGACQPAACDWGEVKGQGFASHVDGHDVAAILASYDTQLSQTVLTVSLDLDGRLRVQRFVHFLGGGQRTDASSVDYFTRQADATLPDTATPATAQPTQQSYPAQPAPSAFPATAQPTQPSGYPAQPSTYPAPAAPYPTTDSNQPASAPAYSSPDVTPPAQPSPDPSPQPESAPDAPHL